MGFIIGLIFIVMFIVGPSLATSFLLWEWQWFWESNTGWRVLIFLMLVGGGSRA